MESNEGGLFPIKLSELEDNIKKASSLLRRVSWHPKVKKERVKSELAMDIIKSIGEKNSLETIDISQEAKKISSDPLLIYSSDIAYTLDVVRKGIALGMHSANLYSKASNFYTLKEQQAKGALRNDSKAQSEFREKNATTSAILMFVTASFIVNRLKNYKSEELESLRLNFEGIVEDLHLANFIHALNYMLYYYGFFISSSKIKSELSFVKTTLLYFQDIINEIDFIKDSLKYIESFSNKKYKLEDEDFIIDGFNTHIGEQISHTQFNKVQWEEIVGNTMYKHSSKRTIQFLMCYDTKREANPINELGGFPGITMEYGIPGTGKSMGISATATELSERCKDLGIKFLFHPIPQTIISTYQGGSSENMQKWFKATTNPKMIIYAPIDDGDGKLRDRGERGTSSGVIEVVESFLVNTEGASASKRGNRLIQIYTNLPEKLDKAVLSRVQKRSILEGAVSEYDFLDQDYLWWRSYKEMIAGFVDMKNPMDYEYMKAQDIALKISEKLQEFSNSKVYKIEQIIDKTLKEAKVDEQIFFAKLYTNVKKEFPIFSSRDVRNIQSAVNTRLTDFDFPDEWMSDQSLFFAKDYDTKLNMLREVMKENMKGLSFFEIRFQESVRYLDNMATIEDKDFEKRVIEGIEEFKIQQEIKRRLKLQLM